MFHEKEHTINNDPPKRISPHSIANQKLVLCANSLTGVYNTNSYLVPDLCWIFFSLNVANYLKYVPLSSFSVADFLSKQDDEKKLLKKVSFRNGRP